MRPPDARAELFDIERACDLLSQFTGGKTLADYQADAMLRSAVERQFEIIGEALRRAVEQDPSLKDRITDIARIVAFRNRLIHGYATVSDQVVWGIVESNLPRLHREAKALLAELGS
jgi:uncharacterized protein with HEPN domain